MTGTEIIISSETINNISKVFNSLSTSDIRSLIIATISLGISIISIILTRKQNKELMEQNRELSKRPESVQTASFDIEDKNWEVLELLVAFLPTTQDWFRWRYRNIYDIDGKHIQRSSSIHQHFFDSKKACINHALKNAKWSPYKIIK